VSVGRTCPPTKGVDGRIVAARLARPFTGTVTRVRHGPRGGGGRRRFPSGPLRAPPEWGWCGSDRLLGGRGDVSARSIGHQYSLSRLIVVSAASSVLPFSGRCGARQARPFRTRRYTITLPVCSARRSRGRLRFRTANTCVLNRGAFLSPRGACARMLPVPGPGAPLERKWTRCLRLAARRAVWLPKDVVSEMRLDARVRGVLLAPGRIRGALPRASG
jgi:hypothetical protein